MLWRKWNRVIGQSDGRAGFTKENFSRNVKFESKSKWKEAKELRKETSRKKDQEVQQGAWSEKELSPFKEEKEDLPSWRQEREGRQRPAQDESQSSR